MDNTMALSVACANNDRIDLPVKLVNNFLIDDARNFDYTFITKEEFEKIIAFFMRFPWIQLQMSEQDMEGLKAVIEDEDSGVFDDISDEMLARLATISVKLKYLLLQHYIAAAIAKRPQMRAQEV